MIKPESEHIGTGATHEKDHQMAQEIVEYSLQKNSYQGHKIEDDYLVAYFVEPARMLQYYDNGELVVERPQDKNAYIGIAVHHEGTLHFLSQLTVTVKVLDRFNKLIGEKKHFYHARPNLHNYGRNWALPGDGMYTLKVHIEVSEKQSREMAKYKISPGSVDIDFHNVMIHTGHHIS